MVAPAAGAGGSALFSQTVRWAAQTELPCTERARITSPPARLAVLRCTVKEPLGAWVVRLPAKNSAPLSRSRADQACQRDPLDPRLGDRILRGLVDHNLVIERVVRLQHFEQHVQAAWFVAMLVREVADRADLPQDKRAIGIETAPVA